MHIYFLRSFWLKPINTFINHNLHLQIICEYNLHTHIKLWSYVHIYKWMHVSCMYKIMHFMHFIGFEPRPSWHHPRCADWECGLTWSSVALSMQSLVVVRPRPVCYCWWDECSRPVRSVSQALRGNSVAGAHSRSPRRTGRAGLPQERKIPHFMVIGLLLWYREG